jgi:hypothetical protein
MPRFRRTKYLFVYCEDRQVLDIVRLLRGQAVFTPLRQILAISVLTAKEHPISRGELDLLLSIPSDDWVERNGDEAHTLGDLALRGLVLTDESDDHLRELQRADEVLSSSQWNVYAALYHFLTKWHDVHVNLPDKPPDPDELEAETAAFIRTYGPPRRISTPPPTHSR